jgi:hypothetical protein
MKPCSGTQNGATPNVVPAIGAPQIVNTEQSRIAPHKSVTPLILVANEGAGTGGSISEFAETASGNVAPSTTITSHFGGPLAIAFSSTRGIGLADGNIDSESLFGAETFALATGDFLTGIMCFGKPSQTNGVAFDSRGHLYVSAFLGRTHAVEVFKPGASGCAKPSRTIPDAGGLAIDSNNVLYVANRTAATIDLFAAGSNTIEAQIGGSNTGLQAPSTVALDAALNVYVFDLQTATISEFAAGARGNVAPIRTISGSNTGLGGGNGFSFGVAVSKTSGEIFVSNPGSNAILGFAAHATGNTAPIQTIAGSATGLSDPLGLALAE